MPEYVRYLYFICLAALLCAACDKPAADSAETPPLQDRPQAEAAAPQTEPQREASNPIPVYFRGAQITAQPGGIPAGFKAMPVAGVSLQPAAAGEAPKALADGRAETSWRMQAERGQAPLIVYDLGPLAEAAPLYGLYINIRNAAEEGRKPIDYRPFVLSIKLLDDESRAAAPLREAAPAAVDGDGAPAAAELAAQPSAAQIDADIEKGLYLALLKSEWVSLNGEQVLLFDKALELRRDRAGRLLAEIEYVFGEEERRFLDISEIALLSAAEAGAQEPLPLAKLEVPAVAGCYRNREGRRVDIYASGMMRLAAPSNSEKKAAPTPRNNNPQSAPETASPESDEKYASWRVLNGRFIFNVGGEGEMSNTIPGQAAHDFTPEFSAMQRDASCSEPWGDISAELAAANLGGKKDITAVWRSDCDGDRIPELVAYLKDKKKAVVLRHSREWEAYSLWREIDLSGDFRLMSDPLSGNCILCEKDMQDGGWWINIYLSNNWHRSRRLTLPGE